MYVKRCEKCGTSINDYYRTGMLGCPHCYSAFREEIKASLMEIQGSQMHVGKRLTDGLDKQLLDEYKRLLSEKEKAVMDGKFNEVREISQQLYALTEELKKRRLI